MKNLLSKRAGQLKPSATLAISAMAKELKNRGVDVVGFGAGEPDFPTPMAIRDAAKKSLDRGETFYTPVDGIPALKKAIVERFNADYGLLYEPQHVLVSCGAKHSLYNLFQAILDPGDEVVILAPYWVSYPEMVELLGGSPVIVETSEQDGFIPDLGKIESVIGPRTKAILLNSPSNPTGVMYPRIFMERLSEVAEKHDLIVISDEIYDKFLYDGKQFAPFASFPGMKDRTVTINGVSKSYAMTGFRIGYLASTNVPLVKAASNIQSQSTSNPSSTAQAAAVQALIGPQEEVGRMRDVFEKRRNLMMDELRKINGVSAVQPDGAFYVFMNTSRLYGKKNINNSADMSRFFLETQSVACVPGGPFGSENHVRLSFALSEETILKGMERIRNACRELA